MSMNQFLTRSSGVTTHVDGASSNVCLARSLALAFQVRASAFLAVHMARLLRGTLRRRDSADAEERWQLRLELRLSPLLAK
jgi:hypothetical protein